MLPVVRKFAFTLFAMTSFSSAQSSIEWQSLPSLPDPIGFAGSFAGVSNGSLLVAGGANFPERPPWEGGTKVWHDRIFALAPNAAEWTDAGRLPRPNGYGVSVTVPDGVVLIGGGDPEGHFAEVWLAQHDGVRVRLTAWPALPKPLAMAAGALVQGTIYIAGGIDRPDATRSQRTVYALAIDELARGWKLVPDWPGPGRILATAGAHEDGFYIFGGADLMPDADGKPRRTWLRDAWRYRPRDGWSPLADLPRAAVAAPTPVPALDRHLLVLGGDDGCQLGVAPTEHRGFPRQMLAYDVRADRWSEGGTMPFSLVTTSTAAWCGRIVIPGGEARPGIRSTDGWEGAVK